jgi:Holliday junction DNA helicase RuvA
MIGYIQGMLLQKKEDRLLVLANQVGYELVLPAVVMASLADKSAGEEVAFYVYFHQTDRQPKPVLIGFNREIEKEFFQQFISVEDIGPLKAVKAMDIPVGEIARAIEARDVETLKKLKGIGLRTAQKLVAALAGKVGKYALLQEAQRPFAPAMDDVVQQVLAVLVEQLGHKPVEAKRMVNDALKRNARIMTAEALFEEVYRSQAKP